VNGLQEVFCRSLVKSRSRKVAFSQIPTFGESRFSGIGAEKRISDAPDRDVDLYWRTDNS
jgi:hypothetical protein